MSQKKHNFGTNVCRYFDWEDQIDYVRPCETDKYCQKTETSSLTSTMNKIYTCQKYIYIPPNPVTPITLKDKGETCTKHNECGYGLSCITTGSETATKCNIVCSTGETAYKINGIYECRYDENKCKYTKDNYLISYTTRNCKVCGKIDSQDKKDDDEKPYKIINTADENDKFSQPDGTFVIDGEACQSGTALYFYLDGNIKNEIDATHSSENKLYYRCVTIKAVDYKHQRLNYTIGTEKVYIYDINEIEYDDLTKMNELTSFCNRYLMTKIELWNKNKEEYIKYLKCPEVDTFTDDFKRKLYYLENPEEYLLYNDQTEVIEYLIQEEYPGIVPIIKAENNGAGFLSSKYFILSLILLFL